MYVGIAWVLKNHHTSLSSLYVVFQVHTHKSAAMLDNLAYVAAKPTVLISHSLNLAKSGKYVFVIIHVDENDDDDDNVVTSSHQGWQL